MKPSLPSACGVAIPLIGAALLFSSCASKPATTASMKTVLGERIVLTEGEYKQVAVTGSNLPVLVSNSPTATRLPAASQTYTLSPEEFQEMVRRGDVLGADHRH